MKITILATPQTPHQTPRTKAQEKCAHFPFWFKYRGAFGKGANGQPSFQAEIEASPELCRRVKIGHQ